MENKRVPNKKAFSLKISWKCPNHALLFRGYYSVRLRIGKRLKSSRRSLLSSRGIIILSYYYFLQIIEKIKIIILRIFKVVYEVFLETAAFWCLSVKDRIELNKKRKNKKKKKNDRTFNFRSWRLLLIRERLGTCHGWNRIERKFLSNYIVVAKYNNLKE